MDVFSSSEFVAAILGAIVGSLGSGIISFLLQRHNYKRQEEKQAAADQARDTALTTSVIFALSNIYHSLHDYREYFTEVRSYLAENPEVPRWARLMAVSNLPDVTSIEQQSIVVFALNSEPNLGSKVMNAVRLHSRFTQILGDYCDGRERLGIEMSKPGIGKEVSINMDDSERERLNPLLISLDDLAQTLLDNFESDLSFVRQTLIEVVAFNKAKFNSQLSIDIKPSDADAASDQKGGK